MPLTESVVADRSAGVVLASAAADALGAPHEFRRPMAPTADLRMTGGGVFGWKPGEWTDDTQMVLAMLSPLATGNRRLDAVEENFLAWFASEPRDVGSQIRAVLGAGPPLRTSAAEYHRLHPDGSGNGALMRIGPAALSFPGRPGQIASYARATTELTHSHVDCIDASVIWAVAIEHTIHAAPGSGERWDFAEAIRLALALVPKARRQWWVQLIDEACARPPEEFHSTNGWVIHAFQAALSAIVHTPVPDGAAPCRHLSIAIETAVRAGGDTDTVAAIAGSLLGARWGASAVPLAWRSVLHGKRLYGRPDLHSLDLTNMARRAAAGGRPDSNGWPGRVHLTPYYRDRFSCGSEPVTLGGVRWGGIAGIAPALDSGADVVVSLCRMGSRDVPGKVEHRVIGFIDGDDSDNPNLAFLLADTADFIAMRVADGHDVYVHCVSAEHRTPALAATFLARHHGMSVDAAIEVVEAALHSRPQPYLIEGVRRAVSV